MNDEAPTPYVGIIDLDQGLKHRRPKGLYRLPDKGVVQVVIKNPEKTGIKVFIVPYDFQDMPNRTKTFLRQRTVAEQTPEPVLGPCPAAMLRCRSPPVSKSRPAARRTLQYAIHLQFLKCKKGKLYLCKDVRVIFSHRAPDSSQKVLTTSEGPSPKYTPWRRKAKKAAKPEAVATDLDLLIMT